MSPFGAAWSKTPRYLSCSANLELAPFRETFSMAGCVNILGGPSVYHVIWKVRRMGLNRRCGADGKCNILKKVIVTLLDYSAPPTVIRRPHIDLAPGNCALLPLSLRPCLVLLKLRAFCKMNLATRTRVLVDMKTNSRCRLYVENDLICALSCLEYLCFLTNRLSLRTDCNAHCVIKCCF